MLSMTKHFHAPTPPSEKITSDSPAHFQFEIASTSAARERGLSGRPDVPHDYGMLFTFDTPGMYGFWMPDMLVSIDIIWLSGDGKIIGIEQEVSPDTYPTVFYPPSPVSYVLETRAGEAKLQGLEVGSVINLPVL